MTLESGMIADIETLFRLLQDIAEENDYKHERQGNSLIISLYRDVYTEQHRITPYTYDVHKWLKVSVHIADHEPVTLYSLRDKSDVVRYCQVLISMAGIKALRRQ